METDDLVVVVGLVVVNHSAELLQGQPPAPTALHSSNSSSCSSFVI